MRSCPNISWYSEAVEHNHGRLQTTDSVGQCHCKLPVYRITTFTDGNTIGNQTTKAVMCNSASACSSTDYNHNGSHQLAGLFAYNLAGPLDCVDIYTQVESFVPSSSTA